MAWNYEGLKKSFEDGFISNKTLSNAVIRGLITHFQFEEITGKHYKQSESNSIVDFLKEKDERNR